MPREEALAHGLAPRGLTGRESEVFALIAHGASNASISQILGTTPRTVSTHVASLARTACLHLIG